MATINVLEVIHTGSISGALGGAETVLYNIVRYIDPSRFTIRALVVGHGGLDERLKREGYPVDTFTFARSYNLDLIKYIRQLITRHQIDIVHTHLSRMNTYGFAATRLTPARNVMTIHGLSGFSGRLGRLYYGMFGNLSAKVVAVSQPLAEEFSARTKVRRGNIVVIPNGIDIDCFGRPVDRVAVRRRFGLAPDAKIILSVGNIRPIKGYDFLIDAFASIARQDNNRVLVIAGSDMFREAAGLRDRAARYGLRDRVMFTEFIPDVEVLYGAADLFALSSISEGFSLTTVEAMASRLPVVSTDCLGPRDIITDGVDGIIVPGRDPEIFGGRMAELLQDDQRRQAMGEAGRRTAEHCFAIKASVAKFETLFASLVNRPETTRSR
ncbi:MAG: glycosyltransferase family 4 protein [candidate division Zixibacteria bacterium]|nr:glycosyltransferase family 4 protein [candidate division Zixibacteria bacterium]